MYIVDDAFLRMDFAYILLCSLFNNSVSEGELTVP